MRILLFTGKGGVGKTTVAAATAVRAAAGGSRTLVVSTDPAHSLADAFDGGIGHDVTEIGPGLWGQQLDAQERMEEAWGEIQSWLMEVFDWAGMDAVEAEELSLLPGLEELFALVDIQRHARSGRFDTLLVDCGPTAETIRFLSLPDVLAWYMERIFPVTRRVNRVVGPVLSRVSKIPVAGDPVFSATRRLYAQLDGVKSLLADADRASVRLVVNPERMVVAEARRTYTYLSLFGYAVDAVVANRLLPTAVSDPWFDRWREVQADQMRAIDEGFAPLPILRADLAETEVVGWDRLARFADALYGEVDPVAVLHRGEPLSVRARPDGTHELRVGLPFTDHDDLDVGRVGDELLLRVGPYRRALVLPDSLRRRPVTGAALREGVLRVTFGPGGARGAGGMV